MFLVVLCKCLHQLVARGSDQLQSLSSFVHYAHLTFHDLCSLLLFFLAFIMFCNFCGNVLQIVPKNNKKPESESEI